MSVKPFPLDDTVIRALASSLSPERMATYVARLGRSQVHSPLDYLRTLRNRIAHHEPIFSRHLEADYQSILTVTGWICPSTRDWIAHHSRVISVLGNPRDGTDLRF